MVRFQIPIITSPHSVLVVTDFDEFPEVARTSNKRAPGQALFARLRRRCRRAAAGIWWQGQKMAEADAFDSYTIFKRFNPGCFREYVLEPGVLYYFNTNKFHNLVNLSSQERITLVVDCFENDWLRAQYPSIAAELDGSATS